MAIGEAILSDLIESLLTKLVPLALSELGIAFTGDVLKDLEKWQKMLPKLQAVLEDAEEKQLTERPVKLYLEELQDVAFDAEDVLDEFSTESLKKELKDRAFSRSSKCQAAISRFSSKFRLRNIMFYRNLRSKVKDITGRFEKIVKEGSDLRLRESGNSGSISSGSSSSSRRSYWRSESSSVVNEVEIFGREKEKEEIVRLVLSNEGFDDADRLGVIPIVGMRRLGKTTLAQLVYNDIEVSNSFELRAWCWVSEEFDIVKITKKILQAVSSECCGVDDLNSLQLKLRSKLVSKKVLLVLDDVWDENYDRWSILCVPLQVVAPGSKVIVTTRHRNVADMMGPVLIYSLQKLSFRDSSSLLAKHALGRKDFSNNPSRTEVAEGIIHKCAGLPLAVKTLGGLLRAKPDRWESILNSKLWDLPEESSGILPALRVSYCHLPSHLKNCFAFCSIFPKGYEFSRDDLVLLWLAEGFLAGEKSRLMEDLYDYFDELLSRSFFEHSNGNLSKFFMHDLMNDLAKSVAGDLFVHLNDINDVNVSSVHKKTRHLSFSRHTYEVLHRPENLDHLMNLRTFIALPIRSSTGVACCFLRGDLLSRALPKLPVLRVLSLSGYCITELPSSIGDLKHLRYLSLSHSRIRTLPESVCGLLNLATLILRGCEELIELPEKIDNLINLCYLDITGTRNLRKMPSSIGNLTGLQNLCKFIAGNGLGIRELSKFQNLGEELSILELNNVTDVGQADDSGLRNKRKLFELELQWDHNSYDFRDSESEVDVLDSLRPNSSLKKLKISSYGGTRFPSWIGDPSFTNMVHLKLSHCRNCRVLPGLGQLPQLKSLSIESMDEVKEVGPEFYGGCTRSANSFPSLQTLIFIDMTEWESWISSVEDGMTNEERFPSLGELTLQNCPKLVGTLPRRLSSLRRLSVLACPLLRSSNTVLPSLNELKLEMCKVTLRSMTDVTFPITSHQENEQFILTLGGLKVLTISDCCKVTFLCRKETGLTNFFALEIVKIKDCQVVASLSSNDSVMNSDVLEFDLLSNVDWQSNGPLGQIALKYLSIESCMNLESISGRKLFSSLKYLVLQGCHALESLPDDLMEWPQRISEGGESSSRRGPGLKDCQASESMIAGSFRGYTCRLEELEIQDCPLLKSFPGGRLPMTLKRLKIICCRSLHSLPEGIMHNDTSIASSLEQLEIIDCRSLRSFPVGTLPSTMKILKIWDNCELDPLSDVMLCDDTLLEFLDIVGYKKLVSLPETLLKLVSLTALSISNCANLESLLKDGLSLPNLRILSISGCPKLTSLPSQMQSLLSLQELTISSCPGLVFLPRGRCLPPNLVSLVIWDCEKLKGPLSDWNLNWLTSLREFSVSGQGFIDETSFPDKSCSLPASLNSLAIRKITCLKSLSMQLKSLTTLEVLEISDCPNLQFLPKKGLPPNLGKFSVKGCPLLAKRCVKNKGAYWSTISSIPCVDIDSDAM